MFCSWGLLKVEALLVALSLAACASSGEPPIEGQYAVQCGSAGNRIDTRQLIGRPEQEAVEFGRRHGCTVRVEVRDGRVMATSDRDHPFTTIGVTIRDGYVDRLCIFQRRDGTCRPTLG
jgi:hypothetical protein